MCTLNLGVGLVRARVRIFVIISETTWKIEFELIEIGALISE